MQIPILVFETACSSGAPTMGRMEVDVAYMRDVVSIDVQVTPLGGDQECLLVPTPYAVELREALGDRVLIDANARAGSGHRRDHWCIPDSVYLSTYYKENTLFSVRQSVRT